MAFISTRNTVASVDWLQNSMLARGAMVNLNADAAPVYFSTADVKFTDTSLGGNLVINPPPQWTQTADIKRPGRSPNGLGMGRSYSENIDDHSQVLTCRFGVATFNALSIFVGNFYSATQGSVARTGRGGGVAFGIGSAAGFVVSTMTWKLLAMSIIGKAFAFFTEKGSSRFYRLKPTMPVYWQVVQTICNQLFVNLGITPRQWTQTAIKDGVNKGYKFGEADIERLQNAFPHLFSDSGNIDIWAIANRAQRLAQQQINNQEKFYEVEREMIGDALASATMQAIYFEELDDVPTRPYIDYLKQWMNSGAGREAIINVAEDGTVTGTAAESEGQMLMSDVEELTGEREGFLKTIATMYDAEMADGSHYVSFRVNYTGPVQESATNQRGESKLAADINAFTSDARDFSFKFAGGNILPGMGTVLGAVKSVIDGLADHVGLTGVLNAAVGGAFVDIPHQWKGSLMELPRSTYTVDLVGPYNHPMAKMMYQYVPLAMLIAAAFPRSTGKQSFYSPPLMEYFDQGRAQSRLAMMDSLTIERGFTNLGFNHANRAMGIRCTFTIADMNNLIHVPVSVANTFSSTILGTLVNKIPGGATKMLKAASDQFFDDDSAFNDYMAVIAGLQPADQLYTWRKMKMNATRVLLNWENWHSPARIMHVLGDTTPGRILSTLYGANVRLGD